MAGVLGVLWRKNGWPARKKWRAPADTQDTSKFMIPKLVSGIELFKLRGRSVGDTPIPVILLSVRTALRGRTGNWEGRTKVTSND